MSDSRELVVEQTSTRGGGIAVSGSRGGLVFEKFSDIVDFSLMMSKSDKAVPKIFRGNPGACMAVTIQATEWGFSPFQVARMAYEVNDQIAYMAQLIHAVVEKRAPLKSRLKFEFDGDGPDLRVIVTGHFRDEVGPCVYESPRFKDIRTKNSPLWVSDPKQQFTYYGSRAWARRFCPEVILGISADDELERSSNVGADNAKDVSPPIVEGEGLLHRLSIRAASNAGFDAAAVAATIHEASGRPAKAAVPDETPADRVASEAGQAAVSPEPPTPVGSETAAADQSPEGVTTPATPLASEAATDSSPSVAADLPDESAVHDGVSAQGAVSAPEPAEAANAPLASVGEPASDPVEAQAYEPPPIPISELEYVSYIERKLDDPELQFESMLRAWWSSPAEKKLRNSFPNITSEILDQAKTIVTARINQLKKEQA
jgi:hypothetical protein